MKGNTTQKANYTRLQTAIQSTRENGNRHPPEKHFGKKPRLGLKQYLELEDHPGKHGHKEWSTTFLRFDAG